MRRIILAAQLAAGLLWAIGSPAVAQQAAPMKVATLNAGWLLDKQGFDRWTKACKATGWDPDTSLAGLPYCNVHDGLKWPPAEKCPKLSKEELRTRPLINDKGCRESKDLSDWAVYQEKLVSLRAMMQALASEGVTMVALQEVFSSEAVRAVLPAGWSVRTSADDPTAPKIPQHVGVAWQDSVHQPANWGLELRLSDIGSRPLRPGLTFTDLVFGKPVQFMVVHLKASCSNQATPISAPISDKEKEACPALEKQVHVLEDWIDARVGKDFILIGDFNRRMTFEPKRGEGLGARPNPKIDKMFPELNDNDPPGSTLWRAQPPRITGANGRETTETCPNGHPAIDHVIVSGALMKRVALGPLRLLPITVDGKTPFKKGEPFVAAPTDHCPHYVELTRK